MSSCLSTPLSDEEKKHLREIREEQLREMYREAIVSDLLTLYTTPQGSHGKNPVDELLGNMDHVLDINRKRIFVSVLKECVSILEGASDGEKTD